MLRTGMREAKVLIPPDKSAKVFPSCNKLPAILMGTAGIVFSGIEAMNTILINGAADTWMGAGVVESAATVAPCWNVRYAPSSE